MAKNVPEQERKSRYEHRVWGEYPKARKLMAKLAHEELREEVRDCYLIAEDMSMNAKVRDNTLKVKELMSQKKGFERWEADRYATAEASPSPFDDLFEELRLDKPQRGKKYDLEKMVKRLDPDGDVRAIFVTKYRRRFRIGNLRAEVTDVEFDDSDEVLRTLAIEGDDLPELVALRKKLGLRDEPNLAMHEAIERSQSD